ncbi:ATP-binding protein [Risungbinella massiliensis]|uniref:ATP-binding protein n=1 Tax=Risungbinella massiliensis TaxID=1329796 RepID=UPI0005CBD6C1|nr:ATP-binding protein [Risungbinella massiliensis]
MIDNLNAYETHFLYDQVETFQKGSPGIYWTILLLTCVALGVLFRLLPEWASRFPMYTYFGLLLSLVCFIDGFTLLFPVIILYVSLLGACYLYLEREDHYIMLGIALGAYLVLEICSAWHTLLLLELLFNGALLVMVSWGMRQAQRAFTEVNKAKEKNKYLVTIMRESRKKIEEYNGEIEETYRRDYLTGLYNLSSFKEQVSRSIARCGKNQNYHVISIDLTDFKQVNMREGIEFGDLILVKLASLLKKTLPSYAHLARYDGDQFAIGFVGDCSILRRCLEIIEKVMGEIRTERTIINHNLGSASYPQEAENADELIRLAEQRLSIEQRRLRHHEEEKRRHLEKLSAVGQLAAGLAHEIRNPLTSIRGFVQISAAESEAVKRWESIILPEIDRINDLLKQFLNLSESRPAKFTVFNLDQLMNDVISLLHPKAILMGKELRFYPPAKPLTIEADAEQLKQVLINLVQNGMDSLGEKGFVDLRWKAQNDRIFIRVQDNGYGIKPENVTRIFEPFFTTKDEGTGMGLSICNRIITDHGGQIQVSSLPGRGTTFTIQLPVRQSMTMEDKVEEEKPVPRMIKQKQPTYLFRSTSKKSTPPFFASGN